MKKISWNYKNILKKHSLYLKTLDTQFKLTSKLRLVTGDLMGYAKKICPDLLLEYKKTAELSDKNSFDVFNWLLLNSLSHSFEKQTSFAVSERLTKSKSSLVASSFQGHDTEFRVFKIKTKEYSFTAVANDISNIKCGINEKKVFLANNKIYSLESGSGLTPGIFSRLILERCGSINDALRILSSYPHAGCSSYLVAQKGEAVLIEATPSGVKILSPVKGFISYSNHFMSEPFLKYDIKDQIFPENKSSARSSHAAYFILKNRRNITTEMVKHILTNTEGDIYSKEGDFKSLFSVVYEENRNFIEICLYKNGKIKYNNIKI
jgi:hypothetical protein